MNIFSNNCIGGFLLKELGERYNHPLYWTGMKVDDFITFMEKYETINLGNYTKIKYSESKFKNTFVCDKGEKRFDMPCIILNEPKLEIRFGHESFETFEEVYKKRLKRHNKYHKNIFILSTWCVDYNDELLYRFCSDTIHPKILVTDNKKFDKSMNNKKLLIINDDSFIKDAIHNNLFIIKKFIHFGIY